MNKLLEFTPSEKKLLLSVIEKRYQDWANHGVPSKQLNRLTTIEREINYKCSHLTVNNNALLRGIIQEYFIDPNQETIDSYKYRNRETFHVEKEQIEKLNSFIKMKNKLLPKYKHDPLIEM